MLGIKKKSGLTESSEAAVLGPAPFRNGRALFLRERGVWAKETFREVEPWFWRTQWAQRTTVL